MLTRCYSLVSTTLIIPQNFSEHGCIASMKELAGSRSVAAYEECVISVAIPILSVREHSWVLLVSKFKGALMKTFTTYIKRLTLQRKSNSA